MKITMKAPRIRLFLEGSSDECPVRELEYIVENDPDTNFVTELERVLSSRLRAAHSRGMIGLPVESLAEDLIIATRMALVADSDVELEEACLALRRMWQTVQDIPIR